MSAGKRFTPEEDRYIFDNYDRVSAGQMAIALGRNRSSVSQRRRKLLQKPPIRKKPKTLEEIAVAARREGLSYGAYVAKEGLDG